MTSITLRAFQNQISQFFGIAKTEGLDSGSKGRPSAALSFAEELLLCPTEDAAIRQMRRDPAATRAFLQIAMFLDDELPKGEIAIREIDQSTSTPFFVLASAVQEYLAALRRQAGDQWE